MRIVSLDYCADQYVLSLAEREQILALSPDAKKNYSYLRKEAIGIETVRPNTEDVLALQPDLVVRSYGGGPNVTGFMQAAGVPVLQVNLATAIDGESEGAIPNVIQTMADSLGVSERGETLVESYRRRLADLPKALEDKTVDVLYITPAGYTTGSGSLIHSMLGYAGLTNFVSAPGWRPIPLERLVYDKPDIVAASFFDTTSKDTAIWSPSRHPVAQQQLVDSKTIQLPGAWTACGAWFIVDAIEALAEKRASIQ